MFRNLQEMALLQLILLNLALLNVPMWLSILPRGPALLRSYKEIS